MNRRLRAAGLAGLVVAFSLASGVALAADFTTKAPQQYMKACTAEGEGFYYVPGTDTCLRIGGYLWAEGYWNTYSNYPVKNDSLYSIATAAMILDARTATEYGTLRSYVETRFRWRSADPWSEGPTGSQLELWNAYIQFAGFTFGHAQSFFDFYANANVLGTDPGTIGDDVRLNLIAYTHEFAKGVSATISLEDAADRQSGVHITDPAWTDAFDNYQAGQQVPDIVGNLALEGSWGHAKLSGALHQTRSLTVLDTFNAESTWGYAVQAGVMFNLPMLGEGDTLYLQSAYANGAISYLGLQDPSGNFSPPDAFVSPLGGLSKVSGWNVTASLLHNWNAKWSSALFGGYASYDYNNDWVTTFYGASGGTNYNVGGYIAFAPVEKLSIALQYDFTSNKLDNFVPTDNSPDQSSVDANRVLLFVSREF